MTHTDNLFETLRSRLSYVKPWIIRSFVDGYEILHVMKVQRTLEQVQGNTRATFAMEGVNPETIDDITIMVCEHFGWC